MIAPNRNSKSCPHWLRGTLVPVAIGLGALGYQILYQIVLNSSRTPAIFAFEALISVIVCPIAAWLVLSYLADRDAATQRAARQAESQHTEELSALHAISVVLGEAQSGAGALDRALAQALELLGLEAGRVYLADEQTGQLALVAVRGSPPPADANDQSSRSGECLCGIATQDDLGRIANDPDQLRRMLCEGIRHHKSYDCATLALKAGERMLGVIVVTSRAATTIDEGQLALLHPIAAQMGIAVDNQRLREEVRRAEALTTLIQEMHHRIKNNLQTVADLLSLEMSANESPEARRSLRDSISRIQSIAAVHQLLSLEHLRLTDITELARQVCSISLRQLTRPGRRVEAEISGPPIYLPSKQATALALVMNELIANALEHAFEDGRSGHLAIDLKQDGPQIEVVVSDDGRGLPKSFDLSRTDGLGLQIARTLVEKDLAGTLRLETGPTGGSRATMTFYR